MSKSLFSKNTNKLFFILIGVALFAGIIPIAISSSVFALDSNKQKVELSSLRLNEKVDIDDVLSTARRKVKWAKKGNVNIKIYSKINDVEVEDDSILKYDKESGMLSTHAIGEGYIKVSNIPNTVSFNMTYHTNFYEPTLYQIISSQYKDMFGDGVVYPSELASIKSLSLSSTNNTFDFIDFNNFTSLEKLYIPEFDNNKLLISYNYQRINKDVTYYVPETLYDSYREHIMFKDIKDTNLYINGNNHERFSVILHKGNGRSSKEDTSPTAYLFSDENNQLGEMNINYISSLFYKGRTLNGLYYFDENNIRRDFAYDDILTKDIHLYTKWNEITYNVNFHFNSLSPSDNDYYNLICTYDQEYDWLSNEYLFDHAPNALSNDFLFLGWALDPNERLGNDEYNEEVKISNWVSENGYTFDFYAIWAYKKINIRYHYGNSNQTISNTQLNYESNVIIGNGLNTYSDDGEFIGWSYSDSANQVDVEDGISYSTYRTSKENDYIDLYAVYSTANNYDIRFYKSINDVDPIYEIKDNIIGHDVILIDGANPGGELSECDRFGYHFIGWRDSSNHFFKFKEYQNRYANADDFDKTHDIEEIIITNLTKVGGFNASGYIDLYAVYSANVIGYIFSGGNSNYNSTSVAYNGNSVTFTGSASKPGYTLFTYTSELGIEVRDNKKFITASEVDNIYNSILQRGYTNNTYPNTAQTYAFTASFSANTYNIILKGVTTKIDSGLTAKYMSSFSISYTDTKDNYTKTVDKKWWVYSYTFKGWSKNASDVVINEDETTASNLVTHRVNTSYTYNTVGNLTLYPVFYAKVIDSGTQGCLTLNDKVYTPYGYKNADEMNAGDPLYVWDFDKGELNESFVIFNDITEIHYRPIGYMTFDDGVTLGLADIHGFFVKEYNGFVDIVTDEVYDYIGMNFARYENGEITFHKLVSVDIKYLYTGIYTIYSAYQYNIISKGYMNLGAHFAPLANIFEVNVDEMKYDEEKKNADIEMFGLFTYDDFKDTGVDEMFFNLFNAKYFKIGIAKGVFTQEYLFNLIYEYLV